MSKTAGVREDAMASKMHPVPGPDVARWFDDSEPAFRFGPTGMAVLDTDGRLLQANPALCNLLGLDVDDVVGRPLTDFTLPEDVETVEAWLAADGDRPSLHGEAWYQRPDRTSLWLNVDMSLVREPERPSYGLVMVQDRTTNKVMEEALRRSNEELDALITSAPVAIYKVDPDGIVLLWNEAAEQTFGWDADEVIGHRLPMVSDDQQAEFAALRRRTLEGRSLAGIETVRQRRDGSPVHVAIWTSPVHDSEGRPTAILAVTVDITERKRADEALRSSEQRFRTMLQNISDTITLLDEDARIISTTGQIKGILGYPHAWWNSRSAFDLAHPEDVERGIELLQRAVREPGVELSDIFRARHIDGSWAMIEVTGVNLLDDPDVAGIVVTTRNVTERVQTQRLLGGQARTLELIARGAPLDETFSAVIKMVEEHASGNRAAVLLAAGDQLVPRGHHRIPVELLRSLSVPESQASDGIVQPQELEEPARAHGFGSAWTMPVVDRLHERTVGALALFTEFDRPLDQHDRRIMQAAARLVSIALDRHEAERMLAHQGLHDDLTGLPNRTLLIDRLERAIARAGQSGGTVSVLFIDLDRFKVVNDSLGHGAGDQLLIGFSERLQALVRPDDTVARFGGDEFVILCEHEDAPSTMLTIADRLEAATVEPFVLDDGAEVFLTVSMGLSVGTEMEADVLLRNADAAMYRAKERGRNRLEVFDEAMRSAAVRRLNLGNDLRRAVERAEFVLHYQPVISLGSGEVSGVEALIRWQHPTSGLLSPNEFIPVTEETGMVIALGEWVIDQALREIKELTARRRAPFSLAVNLSARQLTAPELSGRVGALLEQYDWPPDRLVLELTESVLMDDLDLTLEALERLKQLGVRLAIDDFGTGYSSLTYLQRFPVDEVKIDQSFVGGLGARGSIDDRGTIATAVVGMARALNLTAVAEGVEHPEELAALRALRCDKAQGFLFSPGLPMEELRAFLDSPPVW